MIGCLENNESGVDNAIHRAVAQNERERFVQ